MPDQSANCIVTSPPYWGKRDYGVAGQYGHEDSPAAYVDTMRDVFREARRVLADDGTCWLNLGDSYSASGGGATGMHAYLGEHITTHRATGTQREEPARPARGGWRSPCRTDGWILRNAIVWHKPNAMPESVRDRLNCRHELLFLLAKSPAYWFDLDPIRVPHAGGYAPRAAYPPAWPPGCAYPAAEVRAGYARGHRIGPVRRPQTERQPPARAPQRAQPRRRLVDPNPPLQGTALRRLPDRPPAAVHRRRVQARRGRP